MRMFKPRRIQGRNGKILYQCPLCGHVFVDNKQYVKHLYKSHIFGGFKKKRLKKKLEKYLSGEKTPNPVFKKVIDIKSKILGEA